MSVQEGKSVLFICLGNICRSPMAEAVMGELVRKRGVEGEWRVESAALGPWHVGKAPDPRALRVLHEHGIDYSGTARKIRQSDFREFDHVLGMDRDNISSLAALSPKDSKAKLELLGSYDPDGELIIEDPYYDDDDRGFYKCYEQCMRSCKAFLDSHP